MLSPVDMLDAELRGEFRGKVEFHTFCQHYNLHSPPLPGNCLVCCFQCDWPRMIRALEGWDLHARPVPTGIRDLRACKESPVKTLEC
eukprot:1138012-Pelagomonas_calceolata.AAC.3